MLHHCLWRVNTSKTINAGAREYSLIGARCSGLQTTADYDVLTVSILPQLQHEPSLLKTSCTVRVKETYQECVYLRKLHVSRIDHPVKLFFFFLACVWFFVFGGKMENKLLNFVMFSNVQSTGRLKPAVVKGFQSSCRSQ